MEAVGYSDIGRQSERQTHTLRHRQTDSQVETLTNRDTLTGITTDRRAAGQAYRHWSRAGRARVWF